MIQKHSGFHALLAGLLLLFSALGASAALTLVERAFEITASQLTLPLVESGLVVVAPCSDCKAVTLRATPETLYFAASSGGEALTLAEMREAVRAPGADRELLFVFYRVEDNIVTRIELLGTH